MSRSRKQTPIRGITTAASEKSDKQAANRKLRRIVKQEINAKEDVIQKKEKHLIPGLLPKMGSSTDTVLPTKNFGNNAKYLSAGN